MADFLFAALPWIIIGVTVAVAVVNSSDGVAKHKESPDDGRDNYMRTGMCLGMCIGVLAGLLLKGMWSSIGICIGMVLGMGIGSSIKKK